MRNIDFTVDSFKGITNTISDADEVSPGASQDSLNWITAAGQASKGFIGDHIELRRGMLQLQPALVPGQAAVSGLGVASQPNGNQVPFFSVGQKLFYFDLASQTYVEISSNLLPLAAANDDVSIIAYQNLSGYHVLVSSPNSSFYKIVVANPSNIIDFQSYDLRGKINTDNGRVFLYGRQGKTGKDLINLYISYIDAANYTVNPPITTKTKIVGPATDGIAKIYSNTIAIDNKFQNCFNLQIVAPVVAGVSITAITKSSYPQVTAANHGLASGDVILISGVVGMTEINNLIGYVSNVIDANNFTISADTSAFTNYSSGGSVFKCEQFTDDQNGNLSSNLGGTGTINYVSGAFTLNFNTTPIAGQTLFYSFFEDQSNSNSIAQFNLAAPVNAGDGDFIQQPGFGNMMAILPMAGLYFCFHERGTYQLQIPSNDVKQASQVIYRQNVGIPYWRSAYPTGEGILYLDTLNGAQPKLRQLVMDYSVSALNPAIVPKSISDVLDLSKNGFNTAVVYEWGDFYLLSCKGITNGVVDSANNVMYVMNKKTKYWDKLDYRVNCLANYYGALIGGDSASGNLFVLFSGFDDLGFNINNYWKMADNTLGIEGMKKYTKLVVKGLIQTTQNLNIYQSLDGSEYVLCGTIAGDGQFVAQGTPKLVGGQTMGSNIVGGGGDVTAFPYEAELLIGSDLFNRVSIMVKSEPALDENGQQILGTGVGYLSVDSIIFKDIRHKSGKIMANNIQ